MSDGKIKIGYDFDDTLGALLGPWLAKMGEACDPPVKLGEKDWDNFFNLTPLNGKKMQAGLTLPNGRVTKGGESFGMKAEDSNEKTVSVYEFMSPAIYDTFRSYKESKHAIRILSTIPDLEPLVVTAHARSVSQDPADPTRLAYEEKKKDILKRDYPMLKNVVFTSDKTKLGLDILVDDGPHNIANFLKAKAAANEKGLGILITRAWNVNENIEGAVRVKDMTEAIVPIANFISDRRLAFQDARRSVPVEKLDLPLPDKAKTPEKV
ncbi:MAG: hypothetical protein PW734_12640 [Verrucomicrobium sp.]|nr:hypothetical protein [Verrucomicrobium sp.]